MRPHHGAVRNNFFVTKMVGSDVHWLENGLIYYSYQAVFAIGLPR